MTAGAPESHKSLFVDLYHMCGSVMKCVMVHYLARRCDLAHFRGITLITDSANEVCSETLIFGGGGRGQICTCRIAKVLVDTFVKM